MEFIHISDVNLSNKEGYENTWKAFRQIIDICYERKTDLLLIAGDLFLGHPSINEIREFKLTISKLVRTRVVILAGDHDFLCERNRIYEALSEGRFMLLDAVPDATVLVPECNSTIYGTSFDRRYQDKEAFANVHTYRTRGFHIYMGHGENVPANADTFDYVAMGGRAAFSKESEKVVYAGPLTKGFVNVSVTNEGVEASYEAMADCGLDVKGSDERPDEATLKAYDKSRTKYAELVAEYEKSNGLVKEYEKTVANSKGAVSTLKYIACLILGVFIYSTFGNLVGSMVSLYIGVAVAAGGGFAVWCFNQKKQDRLKREKTNNDNINIEMKKLGNELLAIEKGFDELNYPEA